MATTNQSPKRYIITYKDPQVNMRTAAQILGKGNVQDGVSVMATDASITPDDTLHFEGLGATSITLAEKTAEALKNDPRVLAVEEDIRMFALFDKNPLQGGAVAEWNMAMINAESAWKSGITGKGVRVAVVDTGIARHADLKVHGGASFVPRVTSYNDDNGHGTHCAGIIAAGNKMGVAPDAMLYAVKVLDAAGGGNLSDVLAGLTWALQNEMNVVSMSLGASSRPIVAYTSAIEQLVQAGINVVCASGNAFETRFPWVAAPANSHPHVIAVGAVDSAKSIAAFSSRGIQDGSWNGVSIVAPGVKVNSTWPQPPDSHHELSGTSMACPHVSGAVALLCQKFPNLSPSEIKSQLMLSAIALGDNETFGAGLLNCDSSIV